MEKCKMEKPVFKDRETYVKSMIWFLIALTCNVVAVAILTAAFILRGPFGWSAGYLYVFFAISVFWIVRISYSIYGLHWCWKEYFKKDYELLKLEKRIDKSAYKLQSLIWKYEDMKEPNE